MEDQTALSAAEAEAPIEAPQAAPHQAEEPKRRSKAKTAKTAPAAEAESEAACETPVACDETDGADTAGALAPIDLGASACGAADPEVALNGGSHPGDEDGETDPGAPGADAADAAPTHADPESVPQDHGVAEPSDVPADAPADVSADVPADVLAQRDGMVEQAVEAIEIREIALEASPAAAEADQGLDLAPAAPISRLDRTLDGEVWPQLVRPRICVIGVGGGGGNAVNTMIRRELDGVDFLAANTDAQALNGSLSPRRLQLGAALTRGLGAGCRPEIGAAAAEERAAAIGEALDGAQMCFIAAGMGGGTGTGAAPVIARIAREKGVLTVGVVTKPFDFEGPRRRKIAEKGVAELSDHVDTLIVIPNQNLFRVANERTTFADAFLMADEVLYQGVKGVTDLITKPGLVNLDFADVRAVVDEMGAAMMGSGEASEENRAVEAAERAIDNPLLDELTLRGAKGVLINIVGGPDLKLYEVDAAANRVRQYADEDANIFFGSTIEAEMEGRIRVSVIATGIARAPAVRQDPQEDRPDVAAELEAPAVARADEATAAPLVEPTIEPQERAAQEPAPAEPQQDELVRKLAETMTHDVAQAAAAVSDSVAASPAPPRKPREGRVEIPSFLRRNAS